MKTINKSTLAKFREDFNKHIESFCKENNVNMTIGNIKYNDFQFSTKMTVDVSLPGRDSKKENFETYCVIMGLNKSDYNKKFTSRGKTYCVYDIEPRNRKYPIIAKEQSTGKLYKFTVDAIK